MEVTETKSEGLIREFKIAVPAADIQEKTDGRLKEMARKARLPGFRPGKVPVTLLRKRVGAAVRGEALEEIVKDASGKVLSERGLRTSGQPRIEVTSSDPDADLEYTLAVEVLPDVTPPDYAAITLERLVVEPDPEVVEATLQDLARDQRVARPLTEPRPAAAGDTVVIDFVGRVDGEEFAGGRAEGYELELGSGMFIPGFEDQLIGAEAGETREVTVSFPADYGAENLAGKDAVFDVTVREIREMAPAVLDDALAKRFGKETLADLRQEVVEAQRRELRAMSRMVLKRGLLDRLAELYDFEVPPSMVDSEYRSVVEQVAQEKKASADAEAAEAETGESAAAEGAEAETGEPAAAAGAADHDHAHHHHGEHEHDHHHAHDHDHAHDHGEQDKVDDSMLSEAEKAEYRSLAERRVRLGLVLAEVGRANDLQVTPEELKRAMMLRASQTAPGRERELMELYERYPQLSEPLAGQLLEDKVVDFMLEMGTITERTVSTDELRAALQESQDEAPGGGEESAPQTA